MKIITYLFCIISIITCSNCKTKQKATTEPSKPIVKAHNLSPQEQKAKIYRFTVSFISKGSGTDSKMRTKYEAYIKEFETSKNIKLNLNKAMWGREGDTDYCFDLDGMKKEIVEEFIKHSKELLSASDLVNYGENSNCNGVMR